MVSVPQSYLAPASQPWGRAIEANLATVERDMRINISNTDNALRGITANVNLLTQQQLDLTVAQEALDAQQNTLEAQQAVLSGTRTRYSASEGTTHYGYVLNGPSNGTFIYDKVFNANLTLPYTGLLFTPSAQSSISIQRSASPGFTVSAYYWLEARMWYKNIDTGVISATTTIGTLRRDFTSPTSQAANMFEILPMVNTHSIGISIPGNYEFHTEYYYYLGGTSGSITLSKISNSALLSNGYV